MTLLIHNINKKNQGAGFPTAITVEASMTLWLKVNITTCMNDFFLFDFRNVNLNDHNKMIIMDACGNLSWVTVVR